MSTDVRWRQRFEHFENALRLLREALADAERLSALEKEDAVQRFEFTTELAWKTLKDYLEHQGVLVEPFTPKNVVEQASAARILPDGQLWIDMLNCRHRLAHTYDEAVFDQAGREIAVRFLHALDELHTFLRNQRES